MGATPWQLVVPFDEDLDAVLRTARDRAFQGHRIAAHNGGLFTSLADFDAMYDSMSSPAAYESAGDDDLSSGEVTAFTDDEDAFFDELDAEGIDHSWLEEGTCSVLDARAFVDEPTPGAAVVLSPSVALEWFGTDRPTLAMVEKDRDWIYRDLGRGETIAVVVHDESGTPTEVAFFGYSYD